MITKTCGDCKCCLPITDFAERKGRNCRQSACRACMRIRWRKWNDSSRGRKGPRLPTEYVPLVDFLPMPLLGERKALVWMVAA